LVTGYLRVVGVAPDADIQMVAESIRATVEELGRKGAERWVLDLCYNGGGKIYPMMAGLAPLFGDGLIGQAVDAEGEVLAKWFFEGGQYFREGYQGKGNVTIRQCRWMRKWNPAMEFHLQKMK
jgi:hypothetical protein